MEFFASGAVGPDKQGHPGYYDIPRTIDMEGLAAEFGISYQSVSERLRRGHRNFIRSARVGVGWRRHRLTHRVTSALSLV